MGLTFAISRGLLCQPLMCFSQCWALQGQICIANWPCTGPFHKWTGGPGHSSHTHPIRHSTPLPNAQPPSSPLTSACPNGLNHSPGGNGGALSQADSPKAGVYSGGFVPAVRPGAGLGEETVGCERLQGKVSSKLPHRQTRCLFVCFPLICSQMLFCVKALSH